MKGKSESEVAQSCPTLSNPMDCRLPGSSFHGIFQASVLEWGAINISMTQFLLIFKDGLKCPPDSRAVLIEGVNIYKALTPVLST